MPSTLDLELPRTVRAAATGDSDAFARLVDASRNAVTSIALAICRDVAASEDVAQDVYLVAWRRLPELRNPSSFLPWIRQITRYSAQTWVRDHRTATRLTDTESDLDRRIAAAVDPAQDPESTLLDQERDVIIHDALHDLPDEAREVLILFYREGQSTPQVARLLDLKESAVRKRLQRARQALRRDVFERFSDIVRQTAPGAAFTAAVLVATASAPIASAAALSAGGLGSSVSSKSWVSKFLITLGGAGLGFLFGTLGIVFGWRQLSKQAIDDQERRQLRRLRNLSILATALIGASFFIPAVHTHWSRPTALFGLFVLVLGVIHFVGLPRILKRRYSVLEHGHEVRVRQRLRRHLLQSLLGWLLGALAGGVGLWLGLRAAGLL